MSIMAFELPIMEIHNCDDHSLLDISSYCYISSFFFYFKLFARLSTVLLQFYRARYEDYVSSWSVELMILFFFW